MTARCAVFARIWFPSVSSASKGSPQAGWWRVREVTSPKCRQRGVSRPRWSSSSRPHVSSRAERQRLADIQAAIDAIRSHLQRGDLSDGLIFDAIRIRLLKIGEAVKACPPNCSTPARHPMAPDHPHAPSPSPPLLRYRPCDLAGDCRRRPARTRTRHPRDGQNPIRGGPAQPGRFSRRHTDRRRAAKPRTASESAASALTLRSTLVPKVARFLCRTIMLDGAFHAEVRDQRSPVSVLNTFSMHAYRRLGATNNCA